MKFGVDMSDDYLAVDGVQRAGRDAGKGVSEVARKVCQGPANGNAQSRVKGNAVWERASSGRCGPLE